MVFRITCRQREEKRAQKAASRQRRSDEKVDAEEVGDILDGDRLLRWAGLKNKGFRDDQFALFYQFARWVREEVYRECPSVGIPLVSKKKLVYESKNQELCFSPVSAQSVVQR